jgi:hypothetical protein
MKRAARLAVIAVLAMLGLPPAGASAAFTIDVVPTPSPDQSDALTSISVRNGNDAWAAGYASDGTDTNTLIEHWNGTAWSVIPSANPYATSNRLSSIFFIPGSTRVWAVGDGGSPRQAFIERGKATGWQVVPSPTPSGTQSTLASVFGWQPDQAWAVGSYVDGSTRTLAEHWDGTSWSIVPTPNPSSTTNLFTAVDIFSPTDIWAVGEYRDDTTGSTKPLVEHWDGTSWAVVATPVLNSATSSFAGIGHIKNHLWAVGSTFSTATMSTRTLIERFVSGRWKVVASPNVGTSDNVLTDVMAVPGGGAWAVGSEHETAGDRTLVMHWDGLTWSVVPSPSPGSSASLAGAYAWKGQVWAAGSYVDGRARTLVERSSGS